jgi:hypothetical protein
MAVFSRRVTTEALASWLGGLTERPIGAGQAPPDRPFPYLVVYEIPGGSFSGPALSEPAADVEAVWQINAVALRWAQAVELSDAVREYLLDRDPASGHFSHQSLAVPGWTVMDREPYGGPGDVQYSGAPPKRVFTASERYVLHLTPA